MIIIGEKINGSIPPVAKAIAEKNEEWIKNLAIAQTEAGATFIDVCASVEDSIEVETLKWLIDLVQSVTDTPIAIDSPNPNAIIAALPFCKRPGLVNSISGGKKADLVLPIIADTKWEVIALLDDESGIPKTADDRLKVFGNLMAKAKEYNIAASRFHIDPLVEMLCTSEDGINMLVEVMAEIKRREPTIHITGAVSNISFNLPGRKLINQAFAVLSMNAGLDSAIFDPLNKDLLGMIYATEALLGKDEYCMEYIGAFRAGLFGTPPAKK